MHRISTILLLCTFALLPALAVARDGDIDKVNGAVRVEAGQQAGDVSSVNGAVHVGDGATVRKAGTVNGAVELGDRAQAPRWAPSTARSRWAKPARSVVT